MAEGHWPVSLGKEAARVLDSAPELSCAQVCLLAGRTAPFASTRQQKWNKFFITSLLVHLDLERIARIREFMKGANSVFSGDLSNPLAVQDGNMI